MEETCTYLSRGFELLKIVGIQLLRKTSKAYNSSAGFYTIPGKKHNLEAALMEWLVLRII